MIIIYNKDKRKVQELVDKILQEHPEYGEINVIGDISELPEDLKISKVVNADTGKVIGSLVGDITKHLEDVVEMPSSEELIRAFENAYRYYIPEKLEMPDIPTYEPEPEHRTEFQKLSSFNRKEKNQARKKLEHQALKYQNKHWKK